MTIGIGSILMTTDAVGGTWQYSVDLARALAQHDVEVTLAVLGPQPSPAQRETAGRLRVLDAGVRPDWLCADRSELLDASRRIRDLGWSGYDIVQVNTPALAVELVRGPVVAACHSCVGTWWDAVGEGALSADLAWRAALVATGLRQAHAVVAPSRAQADATVARYRPDKPIQVVHNGRRSRSAHVADGEPAPFVFTAGRLWDRGKGIAVLDRAAARLTVPLRAAGSLVGPNSDRIALTHAEALGSLDDAAMAATLTDRPVFASAARYEPFGLAVLEAAMAGCALVLADIPTFRELWEGAAIFVAPDDADGFAAACQALIDNRSERRLAGSRARARSTHFTPARMASEMLRVYAEARERWDTMMDQANGEEIAARTAARLRRAS